MIVILNNAQLEHVIKIFQARVQEAEDQWKGAAEFERQILSAFCKINNPPKQICEAMPENPDPEFQSHEKWYDSAPYCIHPEHHIGKHSWEL